MLPFGSTCIKLCQKRLSAVGVEFCAGPEREASVHQIPAIADGRNPMEVPGM